MSILKDERLRLSLPVHEIESGALDQIKNLLSMPFLKKLAIMPDVHQGYSIPIGGVVLLDGYVWPSGVGYDIGCGMCHINLGVTWRDIGKNAQKVYDEIMKEIPVGFNVREKGLRYNTYISGVKEVQEQVATKAGIQLGTLGGGNHFIEIGENSQGHIGITIHSGSRKPGHMICSYYNEISEEPISVGSYYGQSYLHDMNWALMYALKNRLIMMEEVVKILGFKFGDLHGKIINENHNHATVLPEGILHRKGATPAALGQIGIIPANMGDGTYITRGLGNNHFLEAASHGAGRVMSRSKAKKNVDREYLESYMEGIITPDINTLLDEAPEAYKNIVKVLAYQVSNSMIEIIDHFHPIIVIKGGN